MLGVRFVSFVRVFHDQNGVLRGYMQDRLNARLMGVLATGNGRRESFAHMTLPRMTNTWSHHGNLSWSAVCVSCD